MLTRVQIFCLMALATLIQGTKRLWAAFRQGSRHLGVFLIDGYGWVLEGPVRFVVFHALAIAAFIASALFVISLVTPKESPRMGASPTRMIRVQLLSPDSTIVESFTVPSNAISWGTSYVYIALPNGGQQLWHGSWRTFPVQPSAEAK